MDWLKYVFGAQVDYIFIVGGIAFLALAVVGNVSGKLDPGRWGRIGALFVGAILLTTGLYLNAAHAKEEREAAAQLQKEQNQKTQEAAKLNAEMNLKLKEIEERQREQEDQRRRVDLERQEQERQQQAKQQAKEIEDRIERERKIAQLQAEAKAKEQRLADQKEAEEERQSRQDEEDARQARQERGARRHESVGGSHCCDVNGIARCTLRDAPLPLNQACFCDYQGTGYVCR